MVVIKFRGVSNSKEVLRKLKRMHNFTKELMECVEDDDMGYDEEDDDEDYRYSERGRMMDRGRGRYRRSSM